MDPTTTGLEQTHADRWRITVGPLAGRSLRVATFADDNPGRKHHEPWGPHWSPVADSPGMRDAETGEQTRIGIEDPDQDGPPRHEPQALWIKVLAAEALAQHLERRDRLPLFPEHRQRELDTLRPLGHFRWPKRVRRWPDGQWLDLHDAGEVLMVPANACRTRERGMRETITPAGGIFALETAIARHGPPQGVTLVSGDWQGGQWGWFDQLPRVRSIGIRPATRPGTGPDRREHLRIRLGRLGKLPATLPADLWLDDTAGRLVIAGPDDPDPDLVARLIACIRDGTDTLRPGRRLDGKDLMDAKRLLRPDGSTTAADLEAELSRIAHDALPKGWRAEIRVLCDDDEGTHP